MSDADEVVAFGLFRMDTRRRTLLADGNPIALHARAFDVLEFLVSHRDRVVTRDEIVSHVWRGMAVGENNLHVQLSAVRRALMEHGAGGLIVTLPGRGYRFVGDVEDADAAVSPAVPAAAPPPSEQSPPPPAPPAYQTSRARRRVLGTVAALACCALLAALLHRLGPLDGRHPHAPPRLSIVVMPFKSLGEDAARNDLADAITDDLTTDLSHLPGSLVIARASADAYRARAAPADQIGPALNVRYVLEGSVRAAQAKMRVNAQLIDAASGTHIWAEHYDAALDRPWESQDDIVGRIGAAVDIVLVQQEVARATRDRPNRPDALDLFFRARSVLDRGDSLDQMTEAQHLLERVTAAEPDFVDALTTLGGLLVRKVQTYDYPSYLQDAAEADRITARALVLSPSDPTALAARGRFLIYQGRCAEAEPALQAALLRDPNNILALQSTAVCAWLSGAPEKVAVPELHLLRIDPMGPAASGRYQLLGLAALFSGHPADAVQFFREAGSGLLPPPSSVDRVTPLETTRLYLIAATALVGDLPEARRQYLAYRAIWPRRTVWRQMAFFNAAQARMARFASIGDALQAAGMPRFADEHEDDNVLPTSAPLIGSDFTPTPTAIPGASVIDTAALATLLATRPTPIVVDVGRHCALIRQALPFSDADTGLSRQALEATAFGSRIRAAPEAAIVVVGTGSSGINSYNAALHLLALGYRPIYWYRGGEEAWAAADMPAEDRRPD